MVAMAAGVSLEFPEVETCSVQGRGSQTVVSNLEGTLLRSRSAFPYFMLVALEAGSALRAVLLLLLSPLIWLLYTCVSEAAGVKALTFLACVGVKASAIEAVARAVLPRFYLQDMHSVSYRVFVSCGKRYVVTATPRIMVDPFLKEYLGVEAVVGTELQVTAGGYATGLVIGLGVLVGPVKARAVKKLFSGDRLPDLALGGRACDFAFMALCKEAYTVPSRKPVAAVPKTEYLKPLVFHDGRLVCRPTPLMSLAIFLWAPVGVALAVLRMVSSAFMPMWLALPVNAALGVTVRVKGVPPARAQLGDDRGVLFVCSHRTLLDPVLLSIALRRRVTAVTYSISRLSELLSPIRTVRLTRARAADAAIMLSLLREGDLAVCPEGTTCREPYLLRFSSLFAELTDRIVPVAMNLRTTMFHGTSARGSKALDPLFFLMNPNPRYEVTFLSQLPPELTCSRGRHRHDVANYVQRAVAASLGFQCTDFTRRDKYRVLAGTDGTVPNGIDLGC